MAQWYRSLPLYLLQRPTTVGRAGATQLQDALSHVLPAMIDSALLSTNVSATYKVVRTKTANLFNQVVQHQTIAALTGITRGRVPFHAARGQMLSVQMARSALAMSFVSGADSCTVFFY